MLFQDRQDAGQKLAEQLKKYQKEKPAVVALPRGGVPVGFEVARTLHFPLQVVVSRKLGAPGHEELGIGAISEGGVQILDDKLISELGITVEQVDEIIAKEKEELQRRIDLYRQGRPLKGVRGKTIILVDDGIATGITARAAISALKKLRPKKIVLAIPVAPSDAIELLKNEVDEIICLYTPSTLQAVGQWYQNFEQVTDEEVVDFIRTKNSDL